ncbi:MAG: SDR family oxidoreductase [Acidimicrobiia bacterium]|nr:SDR family oxidoreductase [Acidimicrobiia bacterium]
MTKLEGKVAVITGGSKGIGRAIAEALARQGADCMLAARTGEDLEAAARDISSATGVRVETSAGDLRTQEGCEALYDATMDRFGRIDILVNSAGATKAGPFLDLDDEAWLDGFALKFHGAVRVSRLFWPQLKASHGSVVNIIGGLARTPTPDVMIAGAVNAAFANFSKALAGQGLRDDVNVNTIHPAQTRTERHHTLMRVRSEAAGITPAEFEQRLIDRQGVRRLAEPEDIANLAVFLCLPESRHINGTSISVDGGGTSGLF